MTLGGADANISINDLSKLKEDGRGYIYLLTFCAALGGFLFGYDTGVINGALVLLQNPDQLNLTAFESETVVSATVAGAVAGAMSGGHANLYLGRRGVILLASFIFTLGLCLLIQVSPLKSPYERSIGLTMVS